MGPDIGARASRVAAPERFVLKEEPAPRAHRHHKQQHAEQDLSPEEEEEVLQLAAALKASLQVHPLRLPTRPRVRAYLRAAWPVIACR